MNEEKNANLVIILSVIILVLLFTLMGSIPTVYMYVESVDPEYSVVNLVLGLLIMLFICVNGIGIGVRIAVKYYGVKLVKVLEKSEAK
jgi:multisubunit Na+/H+ antiporter MnhB subunit